MSDKYGKTLLDMASKLDAITESYGEITELAISVVDNNNDDSLRELMKVITNINKNDQCGKEIRQLAVALKTSVLEYCGYMHVKAVCDAQKECVCDDSSTLDELIGQLNMLVGLECVKQTVNDLIIYQTIQKKRQEYGLYNQKSTLHMAFTGNPGTGKTTVARIVGRIYKKLGLLSKGHFMEVSRTDLIAGYQGQTALKVKDVIERAKGGVLFIDEAYSITENDHSDSYGRECLTELTKALEDYRDDLVVIVAGYTEPMNKFFESNPGLKSRFNTFIEFGDYSSDELLNILESMCKDNDYDLSPEVKVNLHIFFENEINKKGENFANGRLARNIYEDIVMNHARRVFDIKSPSRNDLKLIISQDFVLKE